MLSVRLPEALQNQLTSYCETLHLTKSLVVQEALEKHLKSIAQPARKSQSKNPFSALRGTGNKKFTAEQIMRMTRGDDWNKP
jgi:predicted DNA-binding protein